MATDTVLSSALAEISKNHLECSICKERYKKPKILGCMHSFCEVCLESYLSHRTTRHRGAATIPCPMCRQVMDLPETGIQGLKTNFQLASLVEEISLQEKVATSVSPKSVSKESVNGNMAKHRRPECAQNLCRNCCKIHLKMAAASHTTVTSAVPMAEGGNGPDYKDCTSVHQNEPQGHYSISQKTGLRRTQSLNDLLPGGDRGRQPVMCPENHQSAGHGISLSRMGPQGRWVLHRELCTPRSGLGNHVWARSIAISQPDEMIVADSNNKRVIILNTEGHLMRTIMIEGSTCLLSVASVPMQNRLAIVDNTNYVKVYNKDSTLAFEFPTVQKAKVGISAMVPSFLSATIEWFTAVLVGKTDVDLRSVVVKPGGTIIVGDAKRNVLTEHSLADGSLIRTTPVRIAPWYLAIDSKTRVVISGVMHEVDVVDDSGATLFTIRPTVQSQPVKYCRGVCCNSSGMYLALDSVDVGHVHHYDDNGRFLSCVAQGLYHPTQIAFTADRQQMAVADWASVKMYHKV